MADMNLPVVEAAELKRLLEEDLPNHKDDRKRQIRMKGLILSLESYIMGYLNFMVDL